MDDDASDSGPAGRPGFGRRSRGGGCAGGGPSGGPGVFTPRGQGISEWRFGGGAEGLLMRTDEKVEILYRKEKELKAPVKEGTTVGEICYLVDGEIWRRERLYAAWTVEAVDLSWCGRQILKRFLVAFP